MNGKRVAGVSFVTAPLLVVAGWALMRLGGAGGQEPGWTLAHIAWVLNNVMYAIVCVELYRRAKDTTSGGRLLATGSLIVGVIGAGCLLIQMVIDLVVGFSTDNRADMRALSGQIHDLPGVQAAIYDIGPVLLFLALIVQAIHLAAQGRATVLFAILVTAAVLVNGAELLVEIPLRLAQAGSALILWLAFLRTGRELLRGTSDPARTATTTWATLAGWALILAPVAQLGGWTLMRFGGNEGVEPWATIAHAVWLIGFVLLAIACVELFRRVRSRGAAQLLARVSLAVALISVTASIAEMLVDLYVLSTTDNHAQLKALDQQIRSIPAAEPILYGFGTQLVYLGLLALIIQLAVLKRISATTLILVLTTLALFISYEVLDGPGRQALMPFAVLCMWLALAPLGWQLLKPVARAADAITP
ncbi:hypothetical protein MTP10_01615 [Nonomuraea sp. 3-1Str]|uniref:hypothetical protein n=1 Tax=Nonomuraea sp. 3-1Str TaxID=2929801 RepID=UPI00285D639B|nr:hypothetical protein [Nonomuraea sp. 3-1Str]MDR8407435.1 hypothetical protein [Nonomuraea sp. 3-1Str]